MKESREFVDWLNIARLRKSRTARQALKGLDSPYLDIVAYLILQLLLSSGQRAGAVANMQLSEVREARRKFKRSKGDVVISVIEHKTA